jgi:hypothetical protein
MDICTCGAQLLPDSLFCHKCGKPQREIGPEEPPEPEPVAAPAVVVQAVQPPPAPTPEAAGLTFTNTSAVRPALILGPIALLLMGSLAPVSALLWIGAGFMAVSMHYQRTGKLLTVRGGLRIGWITGVLMFGIYSVLFTASMVMISNNGGLANTLRQQWQMQKANPNDPRIQEFLRLIDTPSGAISFSLMALLMLFVAVTMLSMAGGAIGARFVSRNRTM